MDKRIGHEIHTAPGSEALRLTRSDAAGRRFEVADATWLDSTTVDVVPLANNNWQWYPQDSAWSGTLRTEPRKIRLKLSEVERLRMAAKEDNKLREILQKFTGHIEIEVDFD